MFKIKIKFLTILLIVFSLACGVNSLQAKLVQRSSKKMPSWIGQNSEDKKKFYFSGSAENENFDKARKLAISDALAQAVQSMDMTMSVNTERIVSDTGAYLDDRTKTKTREVRLLDTKVKDVYFEKYEDAGKKSYTVHALVEYNKKDYEEEKVRLAKEYEQLRQTFTNRYAKAKNFISGGQYGDALTELIENLKIIYTYGINQTSQNQILAEINDILSKISFKNSYSVSENSGGINTKISAYFSDGKNIIEPCRKYAFTVKTVNNFSIETIYCGDNGKIDYVFNKVSYLKKFNYKLELDLKTTFGLEEDFYNGFSFRTVSDELNFLGNKKKINLNVSSDKKGGDLYLSIKSYLVQNGFAVVNQNEDYILNVKFNFSDTVKTELKKLQSSDTDLFISSADVTAELVSAQTGTQINSISSSEKGFGKTSQKSYADLLQKTSISIINSL